LTNCSGRLLSRPSFTLTCSVVSFVLEFPAKYAAGSPGRARMRQNVTTTTPASPGAAAASRLETSRRKDRRISDHPLHVVGEERPRQLLASWRKSSWMWNQYW